MALNAHPGADVEKDSGKQRYFMRQRKCQFGVVFQDSSSDSVDSFSQNVDSSDDSNDNTWNYRHSSRKRKSRASPRETLGQRELPAARLNKNADTDVSACSIPVVSRRYCGSRQRRINADPQGVLHAAHSELFEMIRGNFQEDWRRTIRSWSSNYTDRPLEVCVSLANLMLEAAGFPKTFISEGAAENVEVKDVVAEAVVSLESQGAVLQEKCPAVGGDSAWGNFSTYYPVFWRVLGEQFDVTYLSRCFAEDIFAWILPLSQHGLRNLRQASTIAGVHFCSAIVYHKKNETQEVQKYILQQRSASQCTSGNGVIRRLEAELENTKERVKQLHRLLNVIFTSFLNLRWRDRCPLIRREAFGALWNCMEQLPDAFLGNPHRSRLLGWALSDRENTVRLLATECLSRIVAQPKLYAFLSDTGFFATFLPRILELPKDRYYPVCTTSLPLLRQLAEKEVLSDENVEQVVQAFWSVPSLLAMERRQLPLTQRRVILAASEAFADFINGTIFSVSVLTDTTDPNEVGLDAHRSEHEAKNHLALRCILEFFVEFVDEHALFVDTFVTGFWSRTPCLRRIDLMVELFTCFDACDALSTCPLPPLSDCYRNPLSLLILSVMSHFQLTASIASTPRKLNSKGLKRQQQDVSEMSECVEEKDFQQAAETLSKRLVSLLRTAKGNTLQSQTIASVLSKSIVAVRPSVLFSEINSCNLDCKSLSYLSETFLNAMDVGYPFRLLAMLIAVLEQYNAELETASDSLTKALAAPLISIDSTETGFSDLSVQRTLFKLVAYAQSANVNPFANQWNILRSVKACLQRHWEQLDNFIVPDRQLAAPFACVILAMQLLLLAYLHTWADLEETAEQLGAYDKALSPLVPDGTSVFECSGDSHVTEEHATPRLIPKRVHSMTPLPLRGPPRKRQRLPHSVCLDLVSDVHVRVDDCLTKIEELLAFLRYLYNSVLCQNISLEPLGLFLDYTATMGLLDTTRLWNSDVLHNPAICERLSRCKPARETCDRIKQQLDFSSKEADNLVTNWARYIMEVNTFLEGEANDETLKQVTAETLRENANILPGTGAQPAVSFSCLEEPSIPFLGEFLIGTLVNDLKSPFALDSSQSRQLNLSNVLSFIRHLPQSSAVLNQSVLTGLAPGILSLLWYPYEPLTTAISQFVKEIACVMRVPSNLAFRGVTRTESLVWLWLEESIVGLYKQDNTRPRLKKILALAASSIDLRQHLSETEALFVMIKNAYERCDFRGSSKTVNGGKKLLSEDHWFRICVSQLLPKCKDSQDQTTVVAAFKRAVPAHHPAYTMLKTVVLRHYPHVLFDTTAARCNLPEA